MELEDLKSEWKSIGPQIEKASKENPDRSGIYSRADVRTRLFRRVFFSLMITIICGGLVVSSGLWASVLFPVPWLVAFGICVIAGAFAEVRMLKLIKDINLWKMSLSEVFDVTLRIKRYYKRIELIFSILFGVLIGWLSFLPPFGQNGRMVVTWIVLAVAMAIEYVWYKRNMGLINRLADTE